MGRSRAQSTAPSLRCSICNQNFGRQEHLTRHLRIHTREKPYTCSLCEKRFSRLDVLNRHRASHEEQSAILTTPVSSRACKQCANDRVRCSRDQPCKRCSERGLACWYPSTERPALQSGQNQPRSHTVQEGDGVTNQSTSVQLEAAIDARPSPAANPHHPRDPIVDPMIWPSAFSSIPTLYDLDQSGSGVLGVNWISPQYHDDLNWDALLDGIMVNSQSQCLDTAQTSNGPPTNQTSGISRPQDSVPSEPSLRITEANAAVDPTGSSPSEGIYYVDGHGARAPFGGRMRDSTSVIHASPGVSSQDFDSPMSESSHTSFSLCYREAYDNLLRAATLENERQQLGLDMTNFPSHSQMHLYVRHYFAKFHPIFPFIRRASFIRDHIFEWILLLAVAVVGSRYVESSQSAHPGKVMLRLLAATLQNSKYGSVFDWKNGDVDALFAPGKRAITDTSSRICTLQAGTLNVICLLHSGKELFVRCALIERHYLVEACHSLGLISRPRSYTPGPTAYGGTESANQWLLRETEVRLGMMIWFLDSMFMYEFDAKPMIDLEDIKTTLPSQEDLWENPSLAGMPGRGSSPLTLQDALEIIYMEKRLPSGLSEFSISLLVNAVYCNTKKILRRENNRLNLWVPSAVAQPRSDPEHPTAVESTWLPTTPTASKWRNSACDSLDVIHWPANSKAAQSSGSEHHTILHLHLARVIILTPTTYIQALASTTVSQFQNCDSPETRLENAAARSNVLQWVVRDRCKARLSIVHCGALYWHIRRYSCDSVMEPYAIFIATLVLWAFSASLQLPDVAEAVSEQCEDSPEPGFLHLDRPIDDELVQIFVRVGHKVAAHASRVGNILDASAPANILRQGIVLLNGVSRVPISGANKPSPPSVPPRFVWGVEESYSKLLNDLLDATAEGSGVSVF